MKFLPALIAASLWLATTARAQYNDSLCLPAVAVPVGTPRLVFKCADGKELISGTMCPENVTLIAVEKFVNGEPNTTANPAELFRVWEQGADALKERDLNKCRFDYLTALIEKCESLAGNLKSAGGIAPGAPPDRFAVSHEVAIQRRQESIQALKAARAAILGKKAKPAPAAAP